MKTLWKRSLFGEKAGIYPWTIWLMKYHRTSSKLTFIKYFSVITIGKETSSKWSHGIEISWTFLLTLQKLLNFFKFFQRDNCSSSLYPDPKVFLNLSKDLPNLSHHRPFFRIIIKRNKEFVQQHLNFHIKISSPVSLCLVIPSHPLTDSQMD